MRMDGRTDTRTDISQLIVAFRNSAKAPEACVLFTVLHKSLALK
jgi:hypothetical protein